MSNPNRLIFGGDVDTFMRLRYQRRVWAAAHIGAVMTPETANTPLPVHEPTRAGRPVIIVHRYECPSCAAPAGEPCRLSERFAQDYSHVSRHRAAQRDDWRALSRELDISTGWTVGRR